MNWSQSRTRLPNHPTNTIIIDFSKQINQRIPRIYIDTLRSSCISEFFDSKAITRHLVRIFGSRFLHSRHEADFIRLGAFHIDAAHLHPHQHLCLHPLDPRQLPSRQCGLHPSRVPHNRRVLEGHFTRRGHVHDEPGLCLLEFVACYVLRKEATRKIVISEEIWQRFQWLSCIWLGNTSWFKKIDSLILW